MSCTRHILQDIYIHTYILQDIYRVLYVLHTAPDMSRHVLQDIYSAGHISGAICPAPDIFNIRNRKIVKRKMRMFENSEKNKI